MAKSLLAQIKELMRELPVESVTGKSEGCNKYALRADPTKGVRSIDELPTRRRKSFLANLMLYYEGLHGEPYQPA